MNFKYFQKLHGATLVEVIIVVSIVVLVLTAIISGTISSLSVTNYSSKKNQATKLGQEVIEISRKKRDESWSAFVTGLGNKSWCVDSSGNFTQSSTCPNDLDGVFSRKVTYTVTGNTVEVTVLVSWREGANDRTSKIQTVFTQWK